MTRINWDRISRGTFSAGTVAKDDLDGHPALFEGGYKMGAALKDHNKRAKSVPGLRKRWSEKSAVTKRAQTQKVSLAPISILERDREDDGHGPYASEADISARHEGSGQAG
jgi:hypothetical protein